MIQQICDEDNHDNTSSSYWSLSLNMSLKLDKKGADLRAVDTSLIGLITRLQHKQQAEFMEVKMFAGHQVAG